MGKTRLEYFDNLKGVLIILVVAGHLAQPIAVEPHMAVLRLYDFIYSFHMPLFIFVSGLFCKNVYRDGKFRSDLVIFYLALCFLLYAGLQLEKVLFGNFKQFDFLTLGGGSIPWYLMALAAYMIMVPFFSRIKPVYAITGAVFLGVATGFYKELDFLSIGRILVFSPFFLFGYYLKPNSIVGFVFAPSKKRRLLCFRIIAIIILVLFFTMLYFSSEDILTFLKKLFKGRACYASIFSGTEIKISFFSLCLVRPLYYIAVISISLCVMVLVPKGRILGLTRTGSHSLQIYILHAFIYYMLSDYHVASFMYSIFPKSVASALPFLAGIVLAMALGWPNFPQKLLEKFKTWCNFFIN